MSRIRAKKPVNSHVLAKLDDMQAVRDAKRPTAGDGVLDRLNALQAARSRQARR